MTSDVVLHVQSAALYPCSCRYSNVCFLDAVHKTARLAFPLYFLVVKTNVSYASVASFVTQTEDSCSISEALQKIKAQLHAHDIKLKTFMVDNNKAEMEALQTVFPGQ